MQGGVGVNPENADLWRNLFHRLPTGGNPFGFAGEIADRAGDDGDPVTFLRQDVRNLDMPGAPGFVECCKSLVDEQDVHGHFTFVNCQVEVMSSVSWLLQLMVYASAGTLTP